MTGSGKRVNPAFLGKRISQGCAKVRPVEGSACSAALKSEGRNPKPESSPQPEFREWPNSISGCSAGVAINSDLGLRASFGLRSSGLGFGMARTDFRAALLAEAAQDLSIDRGRRVCYLTPVRSEIIKDITRIVVKLGTGVLTDSRKQPDLA